LAAGRPVGKGRPAAGRSTAGSAAAAIPAQTAKAAEQAERTSAPGRGQRRTCVLTTVLSDIARASIARVLMIGGDQIL
jgi:hypothetical protein